MDFFLPLIAGLGAYLPCYLIAGASVSTTSGQLLRWYQVPTVLRELLGVLVRWRTRRPTFTLRADPWTLFRLNKRQALAHDVHRMANRVLRMMDDHRLAYPPSQRQVLLALRDASLEWLALRDVARRAFREAMARNAAQAAARGKAFSGGWPGAGSSGAHAAGSVVSRPVSGWRTVLGVSSSEADPAVIKRAYRTRVSKAHPDKGGSDAEISRLNVAMAEAREELRFV